MSQTVASMIFLSTMALGRPALAILDAESIVSAVTETIRLEMRDERDYCVKIGILRNVEIAQDRNKTDGKVPDIGEFEKSEDAEEVDVTFSSNELSR